MVVKEFLKGNGVELGKFSSHRKSDVQAARRRLKKTFDGEISTPVPRTSKALKDTLGQKNCRWGIPIRINYYTQVL